MIEESISADAKALNQGVNGYVYEAVKTLLGKMVDSKSVAAATTWQRLTEYFQSNRKTILTSPCWEMVLGMCVNDDSHKLPYVLGVIRCLNVFTKRVPKANEGHPLIRFSSEDYVMFVHQGKVVRSPQRQTYIVQEIEDDDKTPVNDDYLSIYRRADGELPLILTMGEVREHPTFTGYFKIATNWEIAGKLCDYNSNWVVHGLKYTCLDAERTALSSEGLELIGNTQDYVSNIVPAECGGDEMTDAFRALGEAIARPPSTTGASSSSHGAGYHII